MTKKQPVELARSAVIESWEKGNRKTALAGPKRLRPSKTKLWEELSRKALKSKRVWGIRWLLNEVRNGL